MNQDDLVTTLQVIARMLHEEYPGDLEHITHTWGMTSSDEQEAISRVVASGVLENE